MEQKVSQKSRTRKVLALLLIVIMLASHSNGGALFGVLADITDQPGHAVSDPEEAVELFPGTQEGGQEKGEPVDDPLAGEAAIQEAGSSPGLPMSGGASPVPLGGNGTLPEGDEGHIIEVSSTKELLNALTGGIDVTIKMMDNITCDLQSLPPPSYPTITKEIVWDFNGYNLVLYNSAQGYIPELINKIEKGASLTLVNAQVEESGYQTYLVNMNYGSLTVQSTAGTGVTISCFVSQNEGTLKVKEGNYKSKRDFVSDNFGVAEFGLLESQGDLKFQSDEKSSLIYRNHHGGYVKFIFGNYDLKGYLITENNGGLLVSDAVIEADELISLQQDKASSSIENCEVTANRLLGQNGMGNFGNDEDASLVVIKGGDYSLRECLTDQNKGIISINGGSFKADSSFITINDRVGTININYGTSISANNFLETNLGKLTITGDTIQTTNGIPVICDKGSETLISGGTFTCGENVGSPGGALWMRGGTATLTGGHFINENNEPAFNIEKGATLIIPETHVAYPPDWEKTGASDIEIFPANNLWVSNTVSGQGADPEKEFTYTVTLDKNLINGPHGDMVFRKGVSIFTLKHGESKTAVRLPVGTGYKVQQSDYQGYQVTAAGEEGDLASGVIMPGDPVRIPFENEILAGGVNISKTVEHFGEDKVFSFELILDDKTIDGTVGDLEFTDGVALFEMGHGESRKAFPLPAGTKYSVQESPMVNYRVTVNGEVSDVYQGVIEPATTTEIDFVNTYTSPIIEVTGEKIWFGGQSHPTVWFKLYRRIGPFSSAVPGAEIKELPEGTTKAAWLVEETNPDGVPYSYFVREVDQQGMAFTPPGYTKTESGMTVWNTYKGPLQETITVVARKLWIDGPSPRPTIYFKLYRNIAGGPGEVVSGVELAALQDGVELAIWVNMPKADTQGRTYNYYVQEVNEQGEDHVPTDYTKHESGLLVVNTYQKMPHATVSVVARKVWTGGTLPRPDIWFKLYRKLDGGQAGVVQGVALGYLPDGVDMAIWEHLPKFDDEGQEYIYSVREVGSMGQPFTPTGYEKMEAGLLVTNTYVGETMDVEATKSWWGGTDPRPTVWFQLMRMDELGDRFNPVGEIKELKDGTTKVTWPSMAVRAPNGTLYHYKVREVNENGSPFTPEGYEKTEYGLTVSNRFVGVTTNVTATKVWVDGEEPRPTIWFQLYRSEAGTLVEVGDPQILEDGTTEVVWEGVAMYGAPDIEYVYSVREVDEEGRPFTPAGYEKVENGLSVTNTYVGETRDVTATKHWIDGEGGRPTVWFQLYRSLPSGDLVTVGDPQMLEDGTTEVVWESVARYGAPGIQYVYSVREVNEQGEDWVPEDYEKYEDGLAVTNTYQTTPQKTITVVARKDWRGGSSPRPDVYFKLHRKLDGGQPEVVQDVALGHLPDGVDLVIWKYLPKYDDDGQEYIYSVREVDASGRDWAPEGYEKEESGLTVTNLYVGETIDVTAEKRWFGGEEPRPTVWFQLFRADASSKAKYGDPQPLVSGVKEVTWTGLAKYGHGGSPFTYWVREMNEQGEYKAPAGYEQYEDGLLVTNTFQTTTQKTITVIARKIWLNTTAEYPPEVWFKLYRRIEGGLPEATPDVDPYLLEEGNTEAIWEDLPKFDDQGKPYIYIVKEVDEDGNDWVPAGYEKEEIGLTVYNRFVDETIDVTAKKIWESDLTDYPTVWFQLYRSVEGHVARVGSPQILESGMTEVVWTSLAKYDENGNEYDYNVLEVDEEGRSFAPDGYEKEEVGLEVTNTYVGDTREVIATKVWLGGEAPRPPVWFQLWRETENGEPEKVRGPQLLEPETTSIVWPSLAIFDPNGDEYLYYVEEVDENGDGWVPEGYKKEEDGLTVTNYFESKTLDLTARKVWVDGPSPRPTVWFQLWRRDMLGSSTVGSPQRIDDGQSVVTWEGLDRYGSGMAYIYWVTEVDEEGYPFEPANYEKEEEGMVVSNRYVSPTITVTGEKKWSGDTAPRPTVWFKLYRVSGGISGEVPGAEIKELGPGTEEVFWEVDQTSPAGLPYEFFVSEVDAAGHDFSPFGYAKIESGMKVWNTYQAETIDVTAEKIWVGENGPKPSIWFQLWRSAGQDPVKVGDPQLLSDGITEVTWTGLAEYYEEDQAYIYSVSEVNAAGEDYTPAGYEKEEVGLKVTNTFTGETIEVKANKIWDGDLGPKPSIWFQLWRSNGQDQVRVGEPRLLEDGTIEVIWPDLAQKDPEDNEYIYSVTEVDAEGNGYVPYGYSKDEDVLTVTNTFIGSETEVTASKVWVGENGPKPPIWFQLWRSGGQDQVRVGDPKRLEDGILEVTWSGLAEYYAEDQAYIYSVTEVDAAGEDYEPYGYSKVENGLTVTNTYTGETIDVTAEKIWVGDIGPRPDVWFQLWRSDGQDEVEIGDPQLLEDGTLEVTWTGLGKYSSEGNEYSYSVTEVDADGNNFVPDGYTKLEEGLTVTNTYAGETVEVKAGKVWVGEAGPKPAVWFQLWRSDGGSPARVGDPELVDGKTDEVTWSGLAEFASPGLAYTYTVTEVDADGADYVPYGYSKVEDGLTVTNTYSSETMSVEASKVWDDDEASHPQVWFQLWRSDDESSVEVGQPRLLEDGTVEVIWTGLAKYYAEGSEYIYTVTEVDAAGDDYAPAGYEKDEVGLVVTNTYVGDTSDVTAYKEWVGDVGPRPPVWFQLWRKDGSISSTVGALRLLEDGTTSVVWRSLAIYAPSGDAYTYYVKEVDAEGNDFVPDGYTKDENGLTVTNTYAGETIDVEAVKIWDGGPATRPTVWFQLWRFADGSPAVKTGTPQPLVSGTTKATWPGLAKYASEENEYTYFVREVDADGNDFVPEDYEKDEKDLTVANSYIIPRIQVTGTKVWSDGEAPRPTVWFKLYRAVLGQAAEEVPGAAIKELADGTTEVTWEVDKTNRQGAPYIFSVCEVNAAGQDYTPPGYTKTESGMKVWNTVFVPPEPTVTVHAHKVWEDGPAPRPDIYFKLYRNVAGSEAEEVAGAPLRRLPDGTVTVSWQEMPAGDEAGNKYEYSVREVNAHGQDYVPANYEKTEDGLTVTNKYVIPKMDVKASLTWQGGPSPKPTVWFKILRLVSNPGEEAVPGTAVKELRDGVNEVVWEGLDATDREGKPYYYLVRMVDARGNKLVLADYITIEDGLQITNIYRVTPTTPATGDPATRFLFAGMLLFLMGALAALLALRRRYPQEERKT